MHEPVMSRGTRSAKLGRKFSCGTLITRKSSLTSASCFVFFLCPTVLQEVKHGGFEYNVVGHGQELKVRGGY